MICDAAQISSCSTSTSRRFAGFSSGLSTQVISRTTISFSSGDSARMPGSTGKPALPLASRRTIQPLILPNDRKECTMLGGTHTQRPGGHVHAPASVSRIARPWSRPHSCASDDMGRHLPDGSSWQFPRNDAQPFQNFWQSQVILWHTQTSVAQTVFLDYLWRSTLVKAAIVTSPGIKPSYGEFQSPVGHTGLEVITVTAAALTNVTKAKPPARTTARTTTIPLFPAWTAWVLSPTAAKCTSPCPKLHSERWRSELLSTRAASSSCPTT